MAMLCALMNCTNSQTKAASLSAAVVSVNDTISAHVQRRRPSGTMWRMRSDSIYFVTKNKFYFKYKYAFVLATLYKVPGKDENKCMNSP